jgi:GNAT superfamily N-acetyltransferase
VSGESFVPREVALLLERIEREAQADERDGAPQGVRDGLGMAAHWFEDTLALTCRHGGPARWNRVDGLGLVTPADAALLERLREHFAWNGGRFETNLSPFARPRELPELLRERGLEVKAEELKWWRDASPAPHARTDLTIERATLAHEAGIERTMDEAFGAVPKSEGWMRAIAERDGWHMFVALDGDTVAATASTYVRGGAAWFGIAGTRPAWRKRGAQSALFAARIEAARSAGARWLTLETDDDTEEKPNPSAHNAARAGFAIAYRRTIWAPRAVQA